MLEQYIEKLLPQIDDTIRVNFPRNEPDYLYEPIFYTLGNTGKKIRPLLLMILADYFSAPRKEALKVASALELFHVFSLVHDDIMDEDELRRGKDTVHKKWNNATAILAGDGLISMANILNASVNCTQKDLLVQQFNRCVLDVCEGQAFDKKYEYCEKISVDEYLNMIRLKTACLIATSCELAAIVANTAHKDIKFAYELGLSIGMAFQIQDDILDLYAAQNIFGKDLGSDLVNNKKSILSVLAAKETKLLNLRDFDTKENFILASKALFKKFDICNKAIKIKNFYSRKAIEHVNSLKESQYKKILNELVLKLNNRDL